MFQALSYDGGKDTALALEILQEWGRWQEGFGTVYAVHTVLYGNRKWGYLAESLWAKEINITKNTG